MAGLGCLRCGDAHYHGAPGLGGVRPSILIDMGWGVVVGGPERLSPFGRGAGVRWAAGDRRASAAAGWRRGELGHGGEVFLHQCLTVCTP